MKASVVKEFYLDPPQWLSGERGGGTLPEQGTPGASALDRWSRGPPSTGAVPGAPSSLFRPRGPEARTLVRVSAGRWPLAHGPVATPGPTGYAHRGRGQALECDIRSGSNAAQHGWLALGRRLSQTSPWTPWPALPRLRRLSHVRGCGRPRACVSRPSLCRRGALAAVKTSPTGISPSSLPRTLLPCSWRCR